MDNEQIFDHFQAIFNASADVTDDRTTFRQKRLAASSGRKNIKALLALLKVDNEMARIFANELFGEPKPKR